MALGRVGGLETTSELTDKRSNGLYVTEELSSESSLCGGIYLEKGREGEREKKSIIIIIL